VETYAPLLELRCAVLSRSGYDAQSGNVPEAYDLLRSTRFDLVITAEHLAHEHRAELYAAIPAGTQVLLLDYLTLPTDLLFAVERVLTHHRMDQSLSIEQTDGSDHSDRSQTG
jgi:hypothetical protein